MALRALVAALHAPVGDPLAKLVLICLADHAGEDSDGTYGYVGAYVCWPSIPRIAAITEASEPTVKRKLRDLEKAGLVTKLSRRRANGGHASNVYRLSYQADLPSSDHLGSEVRITVTPASPTETETVKEPLSAAPPKETKPGKANPVWDALAAVFGPPATRSETSDFAKTVAEIRKVIPAEATTTGIQVAIDARRREFLRRYPDATCSHRVLRNRWAELRPTQQPMGGMRELGDDDA